MPGFAVPSMKEVRDNQRGSAVAEFVMVSALLKDRAADVERYVWGMFPDGASVERQLISTEDLH